MQNYEDDGTDFKERGWRFINVQAIKARMRENRPHFTQMSLSFASGVSQRTLRRMLAGEEGYRRNIENILTALGVDENDWYRWREQKQVSWLNDALMVIRVQSRLQMDQLYKIEQEAYGDQLELTEDQLWAWQERYPEGAYLLLKGSTVIGGMGLWPLSEAIFYEVARGERPEHEIKPEHISDTRRRWYYVGDIILQAKYHKTKDLLMLFLLEQTLRLWRTTPGLEDEELIEFCAILFSRDGQRTANRLHFSKSATLFDDPRVEVYTRSSSLTKIDEDLIELSQRRQELQEQIDRNKKKRGW